MIEDENFSKGLMEKLEAFYNKGVNFYNEGDHYQAQKVFLELNELYPSYKATKSYLKRIERKLKAVSGPQSSSLSLKKSREQIIAQFLDATLTKKKVEKNLSQ